ncbi:TPA: hypothetical protein I7721_21545 [Vibrio vulnificus]|nr:hypothetical protein [Vibrio vulnificus]
MNHQIIISRRPSALVRREKAALKRIARSVAFTGLNYGNVRDFVNISHCGDLCVDLYGVRCESSGEDAGYGWSVDKWETEMLRLPFKNRAEFKRTYRLARLITGGLKWITP